MTTSKVHLYTEYNLDMSVSDIDLELIFEIGERKERLAKIVNCITYKNPEAKIQGMSPIRLDDESYWLQACSNGGLYIENGNNKIQNFFVEKIKNKPFVDSVERTTEKVADKREFLVSLIDAKLELNYKPPPKLITEEQFDYEDFEDDI